MLNRNPCYDIASPQRFSNHLVSVISAPRVHRQPTGTCLHRCSPLICLYKCMSKKSTDAYLVRLYPPARTAGRNGGVGDIFGHVRLLPLVPWRVPTIYVGEWLLAAICLLRLWGWHHDRPLTATGAPADRARPLHE